MPTATRRRFVDQRREQIRQAAAATADEIAASGRQARAAAASWRRFMLSGLDGNR